MRVVELAGLGPGPFAYMMVAQLCGEVLRVDGPEGPVVRTPGPDRLTLGWPTLPVKLKHPQAAEPILGLVERAYAHVDGFPPNVTERLGVGPDDCLACNSRLVYARITDQGRDGHWADQVGHDINYAGLVGVLAAIGESGRHSVSPLNVVADLGGGALFCLDDMLAALGERGTSGRSQVVDVAMVDGVASLTTMFWAMRAGSGWLVGRGVNVLDCGALFYDFYLCSDGEYVVFRAMEEQF